MMLDWDRFMRFFGKRALDGVETVKDGIYRRTVRVDGVPALVEIDASLSVSILESLGEVDPAVVERRFRRCFDLDADLTAITAHLGRDPFMAGLIARFPAVRVPSHWDPFETAMRTVIGQQITVVQAAKLNTRLVERAGPIRSFGRLFPTAEEVLAADLSNMGMPGARVATLKAVAEASLAIPDLFSRGATIEETVERLCKIKGVGPWTANYIALRGCRDPDAFPAGDAGILRGAAGPDGVRPTPAELIERAQAWKPYRAYAAQYLWAASE